VAFPDGWAHRVAITIDAGDIDADLTSWTLVFDQSFASVLTQVNGPLDADGTRASLNGGGDVRFSSDAAGANQLACDIRDWTTNNNPASATCEVAVGGSGLNPSSSSDTTIYLWWGKSGETQPGAATTYGQYNAYDQYTNIALDGRLNERAHGDTITNAGTFNAAGTVGRARDFETPNGGASGDYYTIPDSARLDNCTTSDEVTVEAAHRPETVGSFWMRIVSRQTSDGSTNAALFTSGSQYQLGVTTTGNFRWSVGGPDGYAFDDQASTSASVGTWYYQGGTYNYNGGSANFTHRVNGSSIATQSLQASREIAASDQPLSIGCSYVDTYGNDFTYDGRIDEVRISCQQRSNAWLDANYHNWLNTTGFLTWGSIYDVPSEDDLTASDLTAGTPTLETPTLGQEHDLTAAEISAGSPALETPTLGQTHDLTAAELAAGTPTLGTPTLAEAVDELTASDLAAGTPTLESPTLGQHHTLSAVEISSGAPTLESPSIGQTHQLSASEVTTGAPALETPTLSTEGTDALVAADLTAGAPVLDSPDLGQEHALAAAELAAGAPTLEEPALGQTHELTAVEVTAGAPALETPTLSEAGHALAADPITTGAPTLETPTLGQTHALSALEIATGAPELAEPSLGQTHVLTAQELSCGAPALEAPTLGLADHSLTADDLLAGAPVVEEPDLGQSHAMAPAEILAGVPELEAPTLGQIHGLTAAELAAGAPELGTPLMDIAGDDLTALDLLAGLPLLGEPALGQAPMPRTIAAVERGGIIGRYRP
jgi:hypothetical protein